jgi:hypothetical protein
MKELKVNNVHAFVMAFKGRATKLDGGFFSDVYLSSDKKRAYKISKANNPDPVYIEYIEQTKKYKGNPFLPVVYQVAHVTEGMNFNCGVYIISMELLNTVFTGSRDTERLYRQLADLVQETVDYGEALPKSQDVLEQALQCVVDAKNNVKSFVDIGSTNIMRRGEQLVITDPLGSSGG